MGLHVRHSNDASYIFAVIKAVANQSIATISKIRVQRYDGAAALAGTS